MRRRTRHWLLGGTLALAAVGGLSWQLLRETQTAAIATAPPRAAPSPLPPPQPSSIALPVRVPLALAVDGMKVERRDLRIDARLSALAEVVLGQQPAAPVATPLQAIGKTGGPPGLLLHSAVLADPATLQRPIDKALAKVAARGVLVPEWGRVKVRFGPSTLYATESGKLALGLQIRARGPRQLLDTRGRLWLTARPETQPDSERMLVRDLALAAQPGDDVQLPLLVAVAQSAEVKAALEEALTQDFTRDYTKLLRKIDRALAEVKIGEFRLAMRLDEVHHGKAVVLGQGIYLPVTATGSARLDYAPMLQPRPR